MYDGDDQAVCFRPKIIPQARDEGLNETGNGVWDHDLAMKAHTPTCDRSSTQHLMVCCSCSCFTSKWLRHTMYRMVLQRRKRCTS